MEFGLLVFVLSSFAAVSGYRNRFAFGWAWGRSLKLEKPFWVTTYFECCWRVTVSSLILLKRETKLREVEVRVGTTPLTEIEL